VIYPAFLRPRDFADSAVDGIISGSCANFEAQEIASGALEFKCEASTCGGGLQAVTDRDPVFTATKFGFAIIALVIAANDRIVFFFDQFTLSFYAPFDLAYFIG
jgi:hypothetical protein